MKNKVRVNIKKKDKNKRQTGIYDKSTGQIKTVDGGTSIEDTSIDDVEDIIESPYFEGKDK